MIDEKQLLDLTTKLISFKSVSPDQAGCIDYLEKLLTDIGFKVTRLDQNATSNFIAEIGETGPLLAFAGHIDVVPPGDLTKWKFDPYALTEHDGELYGRGIGDMKGGVAAFIIAALTFIKSYPLNNSRIALLITSDEEVGGADGTPLMVNYLKQKNQMVDYCILGEPSSALTLGDTLKVGRRGSLTGYLEIHGQQGHIAYPDLCINPIHMFSEALTELTTTKWDDGNEFFPPTSLQFANINSGLGVTNVIPNNLSANFNIRYNNLQTAEGLKKQILMILDKHKVNHTIKWENSAKPFYKQPGKLVNLISETMQEQLQIKPKLKTDGGTSDGRFLVDVCHELVEFGPTNKYIHQINERISTKELYNLANIYYSILYKIFNVEKNC